MFQVEDLRISVQPCPELFTNKLIQFIPIARSKRDFKVIRVSNRLSVSPEAKMLVSVCAPALFIIAPCNLTYKKKLHYVCVPVFVCDQ